MSMNLSKPLTLAHLIVGLLITIVGGAFTAGLAWSGVKYEQSITAAKVDAVAVQRAQDVKDAKEARDLMQADVRSIKFITIRMAQKQGIDTSRLEQ